MLKRKKKHTVPGLNTTSTADISFMLLIFFLVTTSMDSDKGLGRQLPPMDPEEQQEVQDVDRNKVLTFHVLPGGKLTKDDVEAKIDKQLRRDIRHFIIEKGPRHIIELRVERDADYDSYFQLQNTIVLAYKEIRDAASQKKYGRDYNKLTEEQRDEITKLYPQRIQETTIALGPAEGTGL